jgi:hypothetical protein
MGQELDLPNKYWLYIVVLFVYFQGTLYLVKWNGFPYSECTWEPATHIPLDDINRFINPTISDNILQIYTV